jgi:hypothetical protein
MDAKQLFFERYDGFQEYPVLLLEGMSEAQIRQSPHPALNPIAWILWHSARCEDVGVNRLLVDRRQVLEDGAWPSCLGVDDRRLGTGMTKREVTELSERLSLPDLAAYRTAVTERTVEVIVELPSEELSRQLAVERLQQVFMEEGAGGNAATQLVEAYAGHTKGWLLGHLALTHPFYHMGQAFVLRAMFGLPNPW